MKEPDTGPSPKTAFQRMVEFTKRIIAVPKSELPTKPKRGKRRPR